MRLDFSSVINKGHCNVFLWFIDFVLILRDLHVYKETLGQYFKFWICRPMCFTSRYTEQKIKLGGPAQSVAHPTLGPRGPCTERRLL